MRSLAVSLLLTGCWAIPVLAAGDPHQHHQHHNAIPLAPAAAQGNDRPAGHVSHRHAVGPAGATYHLRWLDAMVQHHTGALRMAHDALEKSRNSTVRRLAREIIAAQRAEIIALRRMLRLEGLSKSE